MESQNREAIQQKIKKLLSQSPTFSAHMQQEILEYSQEADEEELQRVLNGIAAEDTARSKILQLNADDLHNLAVKISEENEEILSKFSALIERAEKETTTRN